MNSNWKWLRRLLYGLLALAALVIIFLTWLSLNYKNILKHRLPQWCEIATDSLYNISFEDIDIRFLARRATASDLRAYPDSVQVKKYTVTGQMPEQLLSLDIPKLEIDGINWFAILFRKTIQCDAVHGTDVSMTILAVPDSLKHQKPSASTPSRVLRMKFMELLNPSILLINEDSDSLDITAGGGRLIMENAHYDPDIAKDSSGLFFEFDILRTDSLIVQQRNGIYSLKAGAIGFADDRSGEMHLSNLSLKPMVTRSQFYQRIGHQKDMYDFEFPSITVSGADWRAFMTRRALLIDSINLTDPKLHVLLSLIPVPDPQDKLGRFPNEILRRQEFPLHIRQVTVDNAFVKYTEVSHATRRAGDVTFTEVHGVLSNITNIPELIDSNATCTAQVRARTFGQARIDATFVFPLKSTSGEFRVRARQQALDLTRINHMTRNIALLEFESMDLQRFDIDIHGNTSYAEGDFTVLYNNLAITAYKMDGNEIAKDHLKTLLLKTIMLHPNNPAKDKEVRTERGVSERDPYKSFFNLVWKCTMVGALRSTLRSENYATKILDKQLQSEEQRRIEAWGLPQ